MVMVKEVIYSVLSTLLLYYLKSESMDNVLVIMNTLNDIGRL